MIDFQPLKPEDRQRYLPYLLDGKERGCEYSFANLFLWGKQQVAFLHGCVVFFSHFHGKSVYPYPIGNGDKKAVIEAIMH